MTCDITAAMDQSFTAQTAERIFDRLDANRDNMIRFQCTLHALLGCL